MISARTGTARQPRGRKEGEENGESSKSIFFPVAPVARTTAYSREYALGSNILGHRVELGAKLRTDTRVSLELEVNQYMTQTSAYCLRKQLT